MSISKKRLRLQASKLHVPSNTSSPSRTNALAWSIVGYSSIRTPESRSVAWWYCCAAPQAQLLALAGTMRRTLTPRRAASAIRRIIPRSATYGFAMSRVSSRALDHLGDRRRDRSVTSGSVVERHRRHWIDSGVERRQERIEVGARHGSTQPAEAGQEHELELVHDRTRDPQEQIVEATVLEVILEACPTDPADPAIDDEQLPMVEVPEPFQVPTRRPPSADRARLRARLGRPDDTHCDAGGRQLLVEPARTVIRIGARAVDDQPDGHACRSLGSERLGERVTYRPRFETELVEVHG